MIDIFAGSKHPVLPEESRLASGQLRVVAGRTSVLFTAEDLFNFKILSELVKSCKQLCIFLATAKIPQDHDSAPSHFEAVGDFDATQICILRGAEVVTRLSSP